MRTRHSPAARGVALLAITLLPAAGCVTSTQATRLQKDLDDVKRQIFQVQQDTAGSRTQIEQLSRSLPAMGGPDGAQTELRSAIRSLADQVQALAQGVEEIKSRVSSLSQEIQSLRSAGSRAGAIPQNGVAPTVDQADQTFKAAYADYSKGNYELAVMGFGEFLKSYPAHTRAAEAQYWIGECLYSAGKYREAADAMDRMTEKYPASDKVPAAMLKKGYCQIETGQSAQAVTTLQRLLEGHPQTDEARLAAERLKQLGLRTN